MRIAEIYQSVQGEGFLTGTESVFVRASGCNLRCQFCDTPYASWQPEGDDLSVDEIVDGVRSGNCRHVVITGGEPMLFAELIPLCERLNKLDFHITIETAGTLYLPLVCQLMSISPKLSNSTPIGSTSPQWTARHEHSRFAPHVVRRLVNEYPYQIKFVVATLADCDEIEDYLRRMPDIDRDRVLLMPQGTDVASLTKIGEWLAPHCVDRNLRFCPRRQIEWFGFVRGT